MIRLKSLLLEITKKHVIRKLNENSKAWKAWWMDDKGKLYEVYMDGQYGHWAAATDILMKMGVDRVKYESPVRELFKKGWVRLMFNYGHDGVMRFDNEEVQIRPWLMKQIKDLAIELGARELRDDNTDRDVELLEESIFPKEFDRHALGSCMLAAEYSVKYFLSKGITNFKVVEGFVSLYPDQEDTDWSEHTWIEFSNGRKFDPTRNQWKEWGFNPDEVTLEDVKQKYTPQQYLDLCKSYPNEPDKFKKQLKEEMSYNDLLKLTDKGRKARAKDVKPRSIPVSLEDGKESWNFRYKSDPSVTEKPFQGSIQFFKEIKRSDTENVADLPCKVDCGCPDFMYRWAWNDMAQDASKIGPKSLSKCINRRPKPAYDYGEGLCKHLTALAGYLRTKIQATQKSNLFEAMSDVAKTHPNFNVEYYD